ncbi:hypothetical protein GIB67_026966 [Kingdonia uniflora]|uniref:Endoplasmic reticulum transmembrane protein n=1 Tax=Kingdonia uniflora TaxID=39325 RepID=A0A7J7P1H1_9MAGN|nr:hypothetical protein GIB67_026966 [Kingdonia uniflora]
MIQLLFTLIFTEMLLIMIFSFKTPLRKLAILGLDRVKQGRGPVMIKTVAGTIFVVMLSSFYSMMDIQNRTVESGVVNPTDQVLMGNHLLEASLMGFSLFLALMIDRLHHYIRELRLLRKSMEAVRKDRISEEGQNPEDIKALEKESARIKAKIEKLKAQNEIKVKKAKVEAIQ